MTGLLQPDVPLPADVAEPEAIGVVVPARNESVLAPHCLRSVLQALDQIPLPASVVLVAHRCTDATAAVARRVLAHRGQVVVDDRSPGVAGARRTGVQRVLQDFGHVAPHRLWLLSTDADSTVPADWVHRILRHSARGAAAVAGLADLSSLAGLSADARRRYHRLVAAGIRGDVHEHAYAANLAVRADAYLDVGGWPDIAPGEEHALLHALERAGWPVRRPTDVTVRTSGRLHARASGGLGELLAGLQRRQ